MTSILVKQKVQSKKINGSLCTKTTKNNNEKGDQKSIHSQYSYIHCHLMYAHYILKNIYSQKMIK